MWMSPWKVAKLRSKVGLIAIALLALMGCRAEQERGRNETAAAKPAIVTIRLSGWQSNPNEQQLLDQVLRQFEQQNPTIKVKYEIINSEYMDVIKTRLIGDVGPDVFYLEAFEAPLLIKSGALEPLDRFITPEFQVSDFQPRLLKAFQRDGKIYGLPKDFSTLALFYNKQMLKSAGITQPPRTWDEFLQVSKQLTIDQNQDGKIERYGFGLAPELARQVFMLQAFGGSLVDAQGKAAFAESASLRGLELLVDQYRRDRSAAQPSDVGATWGSEMLGQGKAAMVIEGMWSIPYFKQTFPNLDFGTAEVPTVNSKPGTMVFTVGYVMNGNSRYKAESWKLIAYLTDKAGMKAWANQGLALPSRRSLLTELGFDRNPVYAPFAKGATYATIWQAGENLPTIRTNFNNQFVSALLGQRSLPEAMKKAQYTANREIYLSN
jgi:multiple sugar transport system substrate-binding protein